MTKFNLLAAAGCAAMLAGAPAYAQQPYVGQMMWTAATFCPAGWAQASGQLLPISEYETLFQLIGTTYGGDGQQTFALPDLRARVAVHAGTGSGTSTRTLGETFGTEQVTLTTNNLPAHNHNAATTLTTRATTSGSTAGAPAGNVLADARTVRAYSTNAANVDMDASSVGGQTTLASAGGNQPIAVSQPTIVIKACIAQFGIFPSQN